MIYDLSAFARNLRRDRRFTRERRTCWIAALLLLAPLALATIVGSVLLTLIVWVVGYLAMGGPR